MKHFMARVEGKGRGVSIGIEVLLHNQTTRMPRRDRVQHVAMFLSRNKHFGSDRHADVKVHFKFA